MCERLLFQKHSSDSLLVVLPFVTFKKGLSGCKTSIQTGKLHVFLNIFSSYVYRVLLVHTTKAKGPQNWHGPRKFPFFLLLFVPIKKTKPNSFRSCPAFCPVPRALRLAGMWVRHMGKHSLRHYNTHAGNSEHIYHFSSCFVQFGIMLVRASVPQDFAL